MACVKAATFSFTLCLSLATAEALISHKATELFTQSVTYSQALKLREQLFEFARNFLKKNKKNKDRIIGEILK